MPVNVDTSKIEIDADADREWIERIAKTANEICDKMLTRSECL